MSVRRTGCRKAKLAKVLTIGLLTIVSTQVLDSYKIGVTRSACAADAPTGRKTDDRESDLVDALVDQGQFADAESMCLRHLQRSPQGSQLQATWVIRLAAVQAAKLRSEAVEDVDKWVAVSQPVNELRTNYENEPFSPWLRLQESLLELARGEVLAMRSLSKPQDEEALRRAEDVLRKTTETLQSLDEMLEGESATDSLRLREITRRKIIDSLLLRSTLYPPDSEDALAAATEAETAAKQLMDVTASDSPIRESVVRIWAKARREAQDARGAAELLRPWIDENRFTDPATMAEWLLSEMQRGNNDAVRRAFEKYYGDKPANAAKSSAMDLARLKFMIAELQRSDASGGLARVRPEMVSSWVEQIGQRNGMFARRLAETEMLRGLRTNPTAGNITVIVAKAGQLIRGGTPEELLQAATLLDEAIPIAASSGKESEAFQYGVQAAAARAKAGEIESAADTFAAIARKFPSQTQAPIFHFEAAKLLSKLAASKKQDPTANQESLRLVERIEQLLIAEIQTWPKSGQASSAREWLLKIFEASSRYAEAAQVATSIPADSILWLDAVERSGVDWRRAIDSANSPQQKIAIAKSARQHFVTLLDSANKLSENRSSTADIEDTLLDLKVRQSVTGQANLIAAVYLDRSELAQSWLSLPDEQADSASGAAAFASDLNRIRQQSFDPNRLALNIPKVDDSKRILTATIERMLLDGMGAYEFREVAGKTILRLIGRVTPDDLKGQFAVAVAMAWTGDWAEAATRIEAIAEAAKKRPNDNFPAIEALQQGAIVMGGLKQPQAKRRAVELWNRLAAGTKSGSENWHEAKLGTARLLTELGEKDEAAKLAGYILITKPPTDPEMLAKYEAFAEQKP